ncbi:UPF0561 protein C2orf68 homolog isoform X2 [Zootoca vivipara]|uniref:UPF0561 protein C2orf68 homolog isoform X2 n=1 Tax=Zootoca vivipara TaxID=8524 RepID=UPI00293BD1CB|nr:UPF0561 protein C2orf68 homolog isoform X2 [Zootoca vivipara]
MGAKASSGYFCKSSGASCCIQCISSLCRMQLSILKARPRGKKFETRWLPSYWRRVPAPRPSHAGTAALLGAPKRGLACPGAPGSDRPARGLLPPRSRRTSRRRRKPAKKPRRENAAQGLAEGGLPSGLARAAAGSGIRIREAVGEAVGLASMDSAGTKASRESPAWGSFRPGGRLDMSHGFVRHIRRNQIARDDYDREMKEAKEKVKKRHTPAPARPKKPDQQVYHPCRRSRAETISGLEYEGSSESSSSTEPDQLSSGPALFCLEYEADSGKITSIVVHQDNDPDEVAEKVSAQNQLEPAMREALRQRVQEELEKRRITTPRFLTSSDEINSSPNFLFCRILR